jgi:hypothetical protein
MDQRLGHQNEHAPGPTDGEQALQDQAGLDRLAQTHFVGQQDARNLSR